MLLVRVILPFCGMTGVVIIKKILSSSPKNRIPEHVFNTAQRMVEEELDRYNKELEEIMMED